MSNVSSSGATNAPTTTQTVPKQVPIIDPKYDWYQNNTHVFLSFKVSNPTASELTEVSFSSELVTMKYQAGEVEINLQLSNPIIPDQSTKNVSAKKIELKLKKEVDNATWMKVEKDG